MAYALRAADSLCLVRAQCAAAHRSRAALKPAAAAVPLAHDAQGQSPACLLRSAELGSLRRLLGLASDGRPLSAGAQATSLESLDVSFSAIGADEIVVLMRALPTLPALCVHRCPPRTLWRRGGACPAVRLRQARIMRAGAC